jgi:hypothetical protein
MRLALSLVAWAFFGAMADAQTPDRLTLRCEGQARRQTWGLGEQNPIDVTGHYSRSYILTVRDNSFQVDGDLYDHPVYSASEWDEVTIYVHANGASATAIREEGYYHDRMSTTITRSADGSYSFQMSQRMEDRNELRNELVRTEGSCVPVG